MEGLGSLDKRANIITSGLKSVYNVGKTAMGFGNPTKTAVFGANLKIGIPGLAMSKAATNAKANTTAMANSASRLGMRPGSTVPGGITPAL